MSSSAENFMRRAIELSAKGAKEGGAPFGAVVVKDGEIVGEGHNTVVLSRDPSAHGEVVAIREACKKLNVCNLAGCELYTSCEPCGMCTSLAFYCRFTKLYYGNSLRDTLKYCSMGGMIQDVASEIEKRSIPAERVCAEEAYQVFASCIEGKLPSVPTQGDQPVPYTNDKEKFMRRAIELSSIAVRKGNLAFGAVVVKDGAIVSEGHNMVKQTCDPSARAEIVAIRKASKALDTLKLKGCELYTSCEPCALCTCVIWLCEFDKVYYANTEQDAVKYRGNRGNLYSDVTSPVENRSIPAERLCAEEACKVITAWGEEMGKLIDPRRGVAFPEDLPS